MPELIKFETVLDTGAERLGATYAAALLGAANKESAVDQVLAELGQFVDVACVQHPQLGVALASLRIAVAEKIRVLDRLFGGQLHPVMLRFLKVLATRGRLGYIRAIYDAAVSQHDALLGRVVAEVRSAVTLSDDLRSSIQQRLESLFACQVRLQEVVDAGLLGGIVVRVGDTVFDASAATRLEAVARQAQKGFSKRLLENFDRFAVAT